MLIQRYTNNANRNIDYVAMINITNNTSTTINTNNTTAYSII